MRATVQARPKTRLKLRGAIEDDGTLTYHTQHTKSNMANFFDIRARQKEAAAAASSSKTPAQPENNKLQPWVEK